MAKVLYAGCSYTAGTGFPLEREDPNLWVNLLHNNSDLHTKKLLNVAIPGASNQTIFQNSVWYLNHYDFDYAFICWTSIPRYDLCLGFELYSTRISFMPNSPLFDVKLNDIVYTKEYLTSIRNKLVTLINLHNEIVNLISYVNSLIKIADINNTKIFFINSICPWDTDYFTELKNVKPNDYTNFTQSLLNIKNRDDSQIFQLYKKLHNDYQNLGGIQANYWLNLYTSMKSLTVDVNEDKVHPGIKSNKIFFSNFLKSLQDKLGI